MYRCYCYQGGYIKPYWVDTGGYGTAIGQVGVHDLAGQPGMPGPNMAPQFNFSTVIKFIMEMSFIMQGASMIGIVYVLRKVLIIFCSVLCGCTFSGGQHCPSICGVM